jgi:hypothetical protein
LNLKEIIITTIEKSSFNQTLDIMFSWDYNTTTDCLVPYEISKMNNKPSVKAILTDDKIDLKICGISSRAIFGLINSGAELNIIKEDINFGDDLNSIGYNYNITLYLPDKIYLNNKNVFTWNENITDLGKFKSDIATSENKTHYLQIAGNDGSYTSTIALIPYKTTNIITTPTI